MKLALFDIDGTLISTKTHILAEEVRKALHTLKKNGVFLAVATGRQFHMIPKEIIELGFDYFLCGNGSLICDNRGNVLKKDQFSEDLIEKLTLDFVKYGYPLALRFISGTLEVNPNVSIMQYNRVVVTKEQMLSRKQYILSDKPINENAYSCLSHIEEEKKKELENQYPELDFVITTGGNLCDITLKGTNKGKGLETLCILLKIDTKECIAFGDDSNDIEMLNKAGIGVAMGNSLPLVQQSADYVTDSCEELGVVKALHYYGLI